MGWTRGISFIVYSMVPTGPLPDWWSVKEILRILMGTGFFLMAYFKYLDHHMNVVDVGTYFNLRVGGFAAR